MVAMEGMVEDMGMLAGSAKVLGAQDITTLATKTWHKDSTLEVTVIIVTMEIMVITQTMDPRG